MNAPVRQPVIPAATVRQETAPVVRESRITAVPDVIYIDLDFLDGNKIAGGTPCRLSTDSWR